MTDTEFREQVRQVIGNSKLSDAAIDFAAASADSVLRSCPGACWDDATRAALRVWLSAHFIASTTGTRAQETSRKLGDAQKSWARAALGEGLKSTPYGQQAIILDTCGCLQKAGRNRATVQIMR